MGPDAILVVAMRLGEVDQVDPVSRPPLAMVRAGQQAIDQPLVGIGGIVTQEGLHLEQDRAANRSGRSRGA